jgi:DNA-binding phage protein
MQKDTVKVHGFFRVQLGNHDKNGKLTSIAGDSGWIKNQVVNEGFEDYLVRTLGAIAGSKQISHMAIGTGTAPGATDNTLQGETGTRQTVSNSVVASKTLQATAEWASGDHPGGTPAVRNLALVNTSSGGSIFNGQTFSSSTWNSNQGISATYQVRFS